MTAGQQTLTTTAAPIFSSADAGGPCTTYSITNNDATNSALINVAGLHNAGEYFYVAPGATMVFRAGRNAIQTVTGKSSASSVVINGGVVARL